MTTHEIPGRDELVKLYRSVGWEAYTRDPDRLHAAVGRSLRVVCARVGDDLVGLARVVGDGVTIVYLQDILVAPDHQRGGVGTALLAAVLEPFADVRQQVLITDDDPGQRAFYEARGFTEIRDVPDASLRAFLRFT
nr:GNAT family N-acetyltransferase [Propioniciclava soli]